jgi:hypothetical protein
MPFSIHLAEALLNHTFRGSTPSTDYAQPLDIYLSLHDANPTGDGLEGSELLGGTYARELVTFSVPNVSHEVTNSNEVTFIGLPSVAGGITHIGLWDAVTGGNMLFYDNYGTTIITEGDAITMAVGSLTLRLLYLE